MKFAIISMSIKFKCACRCRTHSKGSSFTTVDGFVTGHRMDAEMRSVTETDHWFSQVVTRELRDMCTENEY